MEIQPSSPGYGLAKMNSLNHEYSEGEQLLNAANLVFYGSNIGGQCWVAHVLIMLFLSLWAAFKASFLLSCALFSVAT